MDEPACGLFAVAVAAPVLADRPSFSRTTDDAGVCAYTGNDARTVANLGDVARPAGRTVTAQLADEAAQARRSGYRAAPVTVGGRYPGVLEDGRPYVARLVWVQRGRTLTLTVSPAGPASTTRLTRAAAAVADRFGP